MDTSGPMAEPLLDSQVKRGLRWAAMRQIVTGLVGSVGAIAYTHFLQPQDLGNFGVAFLVYNGLYLLVQVPIRDAVVYYQDKEDVRSSAAFWLLLSGSIVAVILVMALAGLLGQFYRSPLAASLTRGIVIAFFFQAVAVVPAGLLLKRFQFGIHESLLMISQLILGVGWVALSAAGFGSWSLVIPIFLSAIFWAATTWIATKFRPVLLPGRDAYGDIIRFSRNLFGSKLIIYLDRNLDNAAVGTLGSSALGWYSLGENQAEYFGMVVGATIAHVALPAMAAARSQMEKLRQIYLEMLRLAATLSLPMQIGAIVLADLGIVLLLGAQWLGAVPVLRAYLAMWLIRTLLEISDAATSATGRPDIRFTVDLVQLPFFAAGVWFGLRVWGGIGGVAWSLVIVRVVAGVVYFTATMRITQLTLGSVLRYLMPSSLAAALMGVIVYVLRNTGVVQKLTASAYLPVLGDTLNVTMLVLVGVVSYLLILYALDRSGFKAVATTTWQIMLPESWRTRLLAVRGRFTYRA